MGKNSPKNKTKQKLYSSEKLSELSNKIAKNYTGTHSQPVFLIRLWTTGLVFEGQ